MALKSPLFIFYTNASDAAVVTQFVYLNDSINWNKHTTLEVVFQVNQLQL